MAVLERIHNTRNAPSRHVLRRAWRPRQLQLFLKIHHHALLSKQKRHMEHRLTIMHGQHLLRLHMAKHGNLILDPIVQHLARPTRDKVGRQAQAAQVAYACLRRFGLLLADRAYDRDEGDHDQAKVFGSHTELELAHGFDERRAFNIADCATELVHKSRACKR